MSIEKEISLSRRVKKDICVNCEKYNQFIVSASVFKQKGICKKGVTVNCYSTDSCVFFKRSEQ